MHHRQATRNFQGPEWGGKDAVDFIWLRRNRSQASRHQRGYITGSATK